MFPVDNIRIACTMNNTSLAELERKLGFGNGVIARWETSKKTPPYDRLLAIANELNTTVEELSRPDVAAMDLQASALNERLGKETKKAPTVSGERPEVLGDDKASFAARTTVMVELFEQLSVEDQNDVLFHLLEKARGLPSPDEHR